MSKMYPRFDKVIEIFNTNETDTKDSQVNEKKVYDPEVFSASEIKYLETLDSLSDNSVYLGDLKTMIDIKHDSDSVPYYTAVKKILQEKNRLLNTRPYTEETLKKIEKIEPTAVGIVETLLSDQLYEREPDIYEYDYEIISVRYFDPRYVEVDLFYRITEGDVEDAITYYYLSNLTLSQRVPFDMASGITLHREFGYILEEYDIDGLDSHRKEKFNLLYNRTPMSYR